MNRDMTFYKVILYVDDGTNIDYSRPSELNESDVFNDADLALEWTKEHGYDEDAVIEENTDDILNIGEYHFMDCDDDFSELRFKLEIVGSVLSGIDFCVNNGKRIYGTMNSRGFFYDSKFYTFKSLTQNDIKLMESILDYAQFDIKPKNDYSLKLEQKSIVSEIYRLVEQASQMDVGFYFDVSKEKVFAFNAQNVLIVDSTVQNSMAKLTNEIAEECDTTFHGHYDSSKQSLKIVNKSH